MDKSQAKKQIEKVFRKSFDLDSFKFFIRNVLNNYETRENKYYKKARLWEKFWPHINYYERIGKYTDPNGDELDILVVEVPSFAKLERARTTLRNLVVKHLATFGQKDYALAAFYAKEDLGENWRFSFIKIEHEAFRDDKGKVKTRTDFTPARRYSFLVGEHENTYTACKQLLPLLEKDYTDPTIADIETAFSIEKVSDEFFQQYKDLYDKLFKHLANEPLFASDPGETRNKRIARFSKKLLGQIVFLYFLQKKGWLGVPKNEPWGRGDKRFLRNLFEEAENNERNFFNEYLQFLFYEALARNRRGSADPAYYERLDCKIPFLNGGLFEADYDWQENPLSIPNEIFHNDEKNKAGDIGTGILDVFDRYNFTVKEDEPLEKEVAIDPEMLGKVFENMLDVFERKSKGAFYTPREIVHYMCQESLIHYLDNAVNGHPTTYQDLDSPQTSMFGNQARKGQLKFTEELHHVLVPKPDLENFIRKGHLYLENDQRVLNEGRETKTYRLRLPKSVRQHADLLDRHLVDIKICDPAIGSGAFPVSLLHELITAQRVLQPFLSAGYLAEKLQRIHLSQQLFEKNPEKYIYRIKRHAIRESIYGVDIDASAIDIARLRLWLSLIVDEDDFYTIEALPNLDYKIVQGNSLIGFPQDWNSPSFGRIEELKEQFFNETDQQKKATLKTQIEKEIQARLANSKQVFGCQVDFDFRLFFSEVWHEKSGFDVVIGNPPYVQIQKFSGQQIQEDWEKQKYQTFAKTGDIYCLFYEKGHRILRPEGVLAFISSNKWMRANYGKKLRTFFSRKTEPLTLIDFASFHVFETATVDTNILIFRKAKNTEGLQACLVDSSFMRTMPLDAFVARKHIRLDDLSSESWVISSRAEYEIKKRIEAVGTPLKEWDIAINYGIKTGFNEAFIIDGKKKDELIAKDPKSAEIIKPVLRGRDIKRYRVDFADLWLIATFPALNIDINDYPVVRDYLRSFGRKLHQTGEVIGRDKDGNLMKSRKKTGNKWFETQDQIAYYEEFEKAKIVWGNLALSCQFAMADAGLYINAPSPLIGGGDMFLLALLNSTVSDYYIRSLGVTRNGGYFEYKPMFVEKLPVPGIDDASKKPFESLVDYVLLLTQKEHNLQSAFFEQLIDGLVYELYFPDEIKAAGKEILPNLGEIEPLTDDMAEEGKLAIIQREFDRLYDPGHPVRNNLETLDSVEVVRIIREALQ